MSYANDRVKSLDLNICTEVSKLLHAYPSNNSTDKFFIKFAASEQSNHPSIRTIKKKT